VRRYKKVIPNQSTHGSRHQNRIQGEKNSQNGNRSQQQQCNTAITYKIDTDITNQRYKYYRQITYYKLLG